MGPWTIVMEFSKLSLLLQKAVIRCIAIETRDGLQNHIIHTVLINALTKDKYDAKELTSPVSVQVQSELTLGLWSWQELLRLQRAARLLTGEATNGKG